MRFGQSRSNDPLRNRKSQMRLFGQVMLLGFMLIAVQWAAQARHWTWLVPQKESQPAPEIALQQLDFKVKSGVSSPLAAGEVRIASESHESVRSPVAIPVDRQLSPDSLSLMDDGRLGTLSAEQELIDQLLGRLRTMDSQALSQSARTDIGFVELNDRPAEHRGQLLRYSGTLWRLTQERGAATADADDDVYEAWIITPDAANNPTRFLMTEIPPGLTTGHQLDRQVTFAGYFLKRYGYATERGTHIAPLLVGRTLTLKALAADSQFTRPEHSWVQWLAGLVVAAIGTLIMLKRLSRDMTPPQRRKLPDSIPRFDVQTAADPAIEGQCEVTPGDGEAIEPAREPL